MGLEVPQKPRQRDLFFTGPVCQTKITSRTLIKRTSYRSGAGTVFSYVSYTRRSVSVLRQTSFTATYIYIHLSPEPLTRRYYYIRRLVISTADGRTGSTKEIGTNAGTRYACARRPPVGEHGAPTRPVESTTAHRAHRHVRRRKYVEKPLENQPHFRARSVVPSTTIRIHPAVTQFPPPGRRLISI